MGRTTLVEVEVDYTVIYSRKLTFATLLPAELEVKVIDESSTR